MKSVFQSFSTAQQLSGRIRAERLHDFELHLAIVAKLLPIFAAAGRGQYSKALRLFLEQITELEIQYEALVKTFKIVGLHTVRYNEHEWSSEGLPGVRLRT